MSTDIRKRIAVVDGREVVDSRNTLRCRTGKANERLRLNFIVKDRGSTPSRNRSAGKNVRQAEVLPGLRLNSEAAEPMSSSMYKEGEACLVLKLVPRTSSNSKSIKVTHRQKPSETRLKEALIPAILRQAGCSESEQPSIFVKKLRVSSQANSPAKNPSSIVALTTPATIPFSSTQKESEDCKPHGYFQPTHPDSEYREDLLWYFKQASLILKDLHMDKFASTPAFPQKPELAGLDKPILVLDLDETLVHCCNYDTPDAGHDATITYTARKSLISVKAKLNIRPHTAWFLRKICRAYHVVVYTASEAEYANSVCRHLDPDGSLIKKIFSRAHCAKTEKGYLVKDLRMLTGDDTSRAVLVDNSPHCFAPQIHNGIPILPFYNDKEDQELTKLYNFLIELSLQPSMPAYLKKYFQLSKLVKCGTDDDLVSHRDSVGRF